RTGEAKYGTDAFSAGETRANKSDDDCSPRHEPAESIKDFVTWIRPARRIRPATMANVTKGKSTCTEISGIFNKDFPETGGFQQGKRPALRTLLINFGSATLLK